MVQLIVAEPDVVATSTFEIAGGVVSPTGTGGVTVKVAVDVTEPVEFVAVSVYVFVVLGATAKVPDEATNPIPWSIDTVVALAVVHLRLALNPCDTEFGVTVMVAVGKGIGAVTFTVTFAGEVPEEFKAVMV